jgi:hypothetical protein
MMLSVILLGYETLSSKSQSGGLLRHEGVVRSLASLVYGAVQGLIADAVLVGPADVGFVKIADEAGCELIENNLAALGLAAALAKVRQANVFLLIAGHAVERGFVEEARDALVFEGLARGLVLRATPDSLLTRLAPSLARPVGLLARREALRDVETAELGILARRLCRADLNARARKCG